MRKVLIFLLLSTLILTSLSFSYAEHTKSPFKLTLVIPERLEHRKRQISKNYQNKPEFHVLLKNISDEPQKIWSESCSWGYSNLCFEMQTDDEKIFIKRQKTEWEKNFPDYWTLLPNEYLVFDVYITSDEWDFPKFKEASKVVQLKAIYENTSDKSAVPLADKLDLDLEGFWTGKIESETLEVTIYAW